MHAQPRTKPPAPTPASHLEDWNATDLIDLILATHHVFTRDILERIGAVAPKVVAEWQDRDPRLLKALEAINSLNDEMLLHMQREERALFPIVKEIEAADDVSEGDVGAILSPIVCMKREHGFIDEMITYLRTVTDGFTAPAGAGADYRALLADLAAFEADIVEHVRKENDILFPKAMALVPAVR